MVSATRIPTVARPEYGVPQVDAEQFTGAVLRVQVLGAAAGRGLKVRLPDGPRHDAVLNSLVQ